MRIVLILLPLIVAIVLAERAAPFLAQIGNAEDL
jgi:hypothetical protein